MLMEQLQANVSLQQTGNRNLHIPTIQYNRQAIALYITLKYEAQSNKNDRLTTGNSLRKRKN